MIISTFSYVPPWLQRQILAAGLVPSDTEFRACNMVSQLDESATALMLEYQDLQADDLLDYWFSGFTNDPSPTDRLNDVQIGERPVLVRLPGMIVATEARLTDSIALSDAAVTVKWFAIPDVVEKAIRQVGPDVTCSMQTEASTLIVTGERMSIGFPSVESNSSIRLA